MIIRITDQLIKYEDIQKHQLIPQRICRKIPHQPENTAKVIISGILIFSATGNPQCLREVFLVQPQRAAQAIHFLYRI